MIIVQSDRRGNARASGRIAYNFLTQASLRLYVTNTILLTMTMTMTKAAISTAPKLQMSQQENDQMPSAFLSITYLQKAYLLWCLYKYNIVCFQQGHVSYIYFKVFFLTLSITISVFNRLTKSKITFTVMGNKMYFLVQTSQELRMLSRSLSDCKSLLLNVMIQVSQFIRNGQLCH